MRIFTKLFATVFMLLLNSPVIWAQIWSNPITGTNPNTTDPYTTGQTVVTNLTVSGVKRGSGIAGTAANDRFNANSWDTPAMDASGGYFQFTLTPNVGYAINFTNFVYTSQASGTGPNSFAVRSSVDGYAANIGSPSASGATITLTSAAYQNITSAITFRVYGWGANSSTGTYSINSFNFNGAVVAAACTAPTTQASNITFSGVTATEATVNWTNGNGSGRIIKINETNNSFSLPSTGDNPVANTVYAGSGEQTIYNGTGSGPITVTNLNPLTTYHVRVFEFCSPTRVYQWNATTGNSNSTTTLADGETITTSDTYGPFCNTSVNNFNVNFISSGIFTGTYSVELSDASGSFATPTIIGAGNASPIAATIPTGTSAGTAYRIRVVNDAPSTIGSDNGSNIAIYALPVVNLGNDTSYCVGTTFNKILDAGNAGSTYNWNNGASFSQTLTVTTAGIYSVEVTNTGGCIAQGSVEITENTLPIIHLGNDTSYCAGSAFVLTLDAGNPGSTFEWNDNSTNQTLQITQDGNYFVTVTDANGCIGSGQMVVTENALPVVTLGNDTSYCVGSTFTLTLDAGNAGSAFEWNDNSTDQTLQITQDGNYSVTVTDANGCIGSDQIIVTENALPVVSLGNDTAYCAGTNFTHTLDAGNLGATYLWSDNTTQQTLSISIVDTYHVTVTDANGCVGIDTINVASMALPIIHLGNDTSYCAGSTFSLLLNAQNPGSTYQWSNGSITQTISATQAGQYGVTVTNPNGCTGTDLITVTENPLPLVDLGNDISTAGPAQILDAGSGFEGYTWTPGNQTTQQITVTQNGTYEVTVTDANGCSASDEISVWFTASLTEAEKAWAINLYPNPAVGKINISLNYDGEITSSIFSAAGQLALQQTWINTGEQIHTIEINHLPTGLYIIRLTGKGISTSKQFIINK